MKRILVLLLLTVMVLGISEAQYKIDKMKYDYRTWVLEPGDPYNPALTGAINLLIPGLGQMIAGEGGRGAAFLGGYVGCWIIYAVGAAQAMIALDEEIIYGIPYEGEGLGLMVIGLGGAITDVIWSIVDGSRVGKVKNLAFRDKHKTSYYFNVEPMVIPVQGKAGIGMGLQVRF